MSTVPFISDNWQFRCNRYASTLPDNDPLAESNAMLWRSFKEEHRNLLLHDGDEMAEVGVVSVQQGPMRTEAFYDWQPSTGSYNHVQRLLAAHANLRCAIAGTEADRIIGAANVNIRELTPAQMDSMCAQIVAWWDANERTFASPFSRLAGIMRNWLNGVYGDAPGGEYPSLDALRELTFDQRDIIIQTAKEILSVLREREAVDKGAPVLVIGEGLWAESVAVELELAGVQCRRSIDIHAGADVDVLMFAHTQNCIDVKTAEALKGCAVIELVPDQVNPEADAILSDRGMAVVPDLLANCATEIVEDWWIGGKRVATWERALGLKLGQMWDDLEAARQKERLTWHDAAVHLALQRLAGLWQE